MSLAATRKGVSPHVHARIHCPAQPQLTAAIGTVRASARGRWIVAPVTDTLIYRSDRVKPEIARWVDDVAKWDFSMIAPSHFTARPGTPADIKSAFAPTLASSRGGAAADPEGAPAATRPFAQGDVQLLDDIAGALKQIKII